MGLRLSEGLNLDRLAAVSGLQLEAGIVSEPFDAGFDRALGPPPLSRCSQASPKWPLAMKRGLLVALSRELSVGRAGK